MRQGEQMETEEEAIERTKEGQHSTAAMAAHGRDRETTANRTHCLRVSEF